MELNRRRLLAAFPAGLAAFMPASGQAQALTGAARTTATRQIADAVNAVRGLQGRFIQTNPDRSTSGGAFWLLRPGKVRFEYDAPAPLLLVADGTNVALQDRRLRTTDRYPLRSTPLYWLLKANVDLERDVLVSAVERREGLLLATFRDRRRQTDGELTIAFDEATKSLQEWSVRDRQGRSTRVRLVESRAVTGLNPTLFVAPGGGRRYKPSGGQ